MSAVRLQDVITQTVVLSVPALLATEEMDGSALVGWTQHYYANSY